MCSILISFLIDCLFFVSFGLGNSNLPVYRGEIQCRPLGKAVKVFDEKGDEIFQRKGGMMKGERERDKM
jgi:hypothetical protein